MLFNFQFQNVVVVIIIYLLRQWNDGINKTSLFSLWPSCGLSMVRLCRHGGLGSIMVFDYNVIMDP